MHQESFCIGIVDRWIMIELWGQWRFTLLQSTSVYEHMLSMVTLDAGCVSWALSLAYSCVPCVCPNYFSCHSLANWETDICDCFHLLDLLCVEAGAFSTDRSCSLCSVKIRYSSLFSQHSQALCQPPCNASSVTISMSLSHRCIGEVHSCVQLLFMQFMQHDHSMKWLYRHHASQEYRSMWGTKMLLMGVLKGELYSAVLGRTKLWSKMLPWILSGHRTPILSVSLLCVCSLCPPPLRDDWNISSGRDGHFNFLLFPCSFHFHFHPTCLCTRSLPSLSDARFFLASCSCAWAKGRQHSLGTLLTISPSPLCLILSGSIQDTSSVFRRDGA